MLGSNPFGREGMTPLMAIPMTADQTLAALRGEGLSPAIPYRDWRTHSRNHKGPWGPVHGVVIHHTAGGNSLALCHDGTDPLPGPLCHAHLAKDGTLSVLSVGRANHAGTLAQNAFQAARDETGEHPRPDAAEPVDGNRHFYGIEIENRGDGKDPYPGVQYWAAVTWAAAVCRFHGWSAHSVIGHKEGTRRKIDPSFDMHLFRRYVQERLDGTTNHGEDDTMTLTTYQAGQLATLHSERRVAPWAYKGEGETRDAYWYLRDTHAELARVHMELRALESIGLTQDGLEILAKMVAEKVSADLVARLAE